MSRYKPKIQEVRREFRIKDNLPVQWHIKNSNCQGQGKIRNISHCGALLETDAMFSPIERCIFNLESLVRKGGNFLPENARLIWFKKKKARKGGYLCGIEFVEPIAEVLSNLQQRIQQKVSKAAKVSKIRDVFGWLLFALMVGLSFFAVYQQYLLYQTMHRSNRTMLNAWSNQIELSQKYFQLYQAGQIALSQASREINTLDDLLSHTEWLLADARKENVQLQEKMELLTSVYVLQLAQNKEELEKKITALQTENIQFSNELMELRGQLRAFNGEIIDQEEGEAVIALYRDRLKLVKKRMKYFRKKAHLAKIEAQKEIDRIKLIRGNNGYVVKDGQSYQPGLFPKDIEINVTFF